MACLLCGTEMSTFSSVSIANGRICKDCASKVPEIVMENAKGLYDTELKIFMEDADEKYEEFSVTSSLGDLHIDELHGLFAIAKKLDANGKPKNRNIFSIYELEEVGIYCKSPKVNNHIVFVDIEFTFTLTKPTFSKKVIVERNARCKTKKSDATHVTWEEPESLNMFKTLFNNMLEGGLQKMQTLLCSKTVEAYELDKARALFMLSEDYEMEDLNRAKRLMLQVYHPEGSGVTRESRIIEKAYYLLANDYKNRQRGY